MRVAPFGDDHGFYRNNSLKNMENLPDTYFLKLINHRDKNELFWT